MPVSARRAERDSRKVGEGCSVAGQDRSTGCASGGRDDEIVCTARTTCSPYRDQKLGVISSDLFVIADDRYSLEHVVHEGIARGASPLRVGHLHADQELGHRDGRDRDVVIVADHAVQHRACALGVDEKIRIEQKQRHCRSSMASKPRSSSNSRAQLESRCAPRSSVLRSAPRPPTIGEIRDDTPATHDGVVLVAVLDRIQQVGEVPCGIGSGDLGHRIRLSDPVAQSCVSDPPDDVRLPNRCSVRLTVCSRR